MLKGERNASFYGPFVLTEVMRQSFKQFKAAFNSRFILVYFTLAKLIQLEIDALGYAIAGIILQQARRVQEA